MPATTRWGRPGRSRCRGVGRKGCQRSVGMLASMTHEHAGLTCNGRGSEQEQGWPGCGGLLAKQTHLSFPSPPKGTHLPRRCHSGASPGSTFVIQTGWLSSFIPAIDRTQQYHLLQNRQNHTAVTMATSLPGMGSDLASASLPPPSPQNGSLQSHQGPGSDLLPVFGQLHVTPHMP